MDTEQPPKKSILKRKSQPVTKETQPISKRVDPPPEMIEEWEDVDTEFEDDYDDEYEEEEIFHRGDEKGEGDEMDEEDAKSNEGEEKKVNFAEGTSDKSNVKAFLGSNKNLKEGESLEFSNTAYEMLHRVTTEWPCLSFDIILPKDEQCAPKARTFPKMNQYPYFVYLAAGTQAASKNSIYLMELSKLHKTKYDDDSEGENEDSEDSDYDEDPEITIKSFPVKSSTNRLVSMWNTPIVSAWHESGDVCVYSLETMLAEFEFGEGESSKKKKGAAKELLQTFKNPAEGFAINFSPLKKGLFATGSNDNRIYLYEADSSLSHWNRSDVPYSFHKDAVEDIQFSTAEEFAFATCSCDGSIKICDIRVGNRTQAQISIDKAHDSDVNVITWNNSNPFLLASGADDGGFKVWDLKFPKLPITEIVWHNESITSISFQPNDESVLAVSSDDNRLSLWDFSCEPENHDDNDGEEIPDQLLFLHQGQEHIKEIRFHPLLTEMIISTSLDGFHLFKPQLDSMPEEEIEDEREDEIPRVKLSDLDAYLNKMSIH